MRLADRVNVIKASPTVALDAKTKELVSQGVDIISFGVGEPDFDTPDHIKEAAYAAIRNGFTKYPPNTGYLDLRQAVCHKLKVDNDLEYKPSQILVSTGAKHSIFNAIMATVGVGDECLIPSPYWVSYPEMVNIAGGTPVTIKVTEANDFKVTPQMLEAAITPRTRALILNTPSNPTGAVYNKTELQGIADVCMKYDLWIISDEIYEKLMYDQGTHVSIASLSPDAKKRTVVVNGVSKAYAMTGWRIGYAAGEPEIIKAMANIQSHVTSAASGISQKASVAGLMGPQEPLKLMLQEFVKRAEYTYKRVNTIPGMHCRKPTGAFYVFPTVTELFGKTIGGTLITDADVLCDVFLEKARVSIAPGTGFGNPENIRLSYATSMDRIVEGLNRVEKIIRESL